jgi:hypothetical protein
MVGQRRLILGIILFGSIWGGLEALGIRLTRGIEGFPSSVMLAVVAILILSCSRVLLKRPGITLACGLFAAGFKAVCLPSVHPCQVSAVLITGAVMELAFTLAERKKLSGWLSWGLVGLLTSYVNYAAFALVAAYLLRNAFWSQGGFHRIEDHVLVAGTYAAILSFAGILMGREVGRRTEPALGRMEKVRSLGYSGGAIAASLGFWVLGILAYRF